MPVIFLISELSMIKVQSDYLILTYFHLRIATDYTQMIIKWIINFTVN